MRRRVLGFIGGGRRRRLTLVLGLVASVAAFTVFMITNALAVHEEKFELDGNVSTQGSTPFNTGTVDWESFFNSKGEKLLPLPAGFTASGFEKDFSNSGTTFTTSDTTTFSTGSKDTLPISTGWECAFAANVNSKIDIMNAYATSYTNAGGEQVLYFGMERNANTGDGNVGVWFLQSGQVGCESKKGSTAFKGDHTTGDLLIVSAFTKGGGVSTINVYEWVGGAKGSLNTEPVAKGADCTSKEQPAKDTVCATTNGSPEGINGPISTPWLTANKEDGVGHTLQASEFFEGGLNLTKAKLGEKCFNTFVDDTRSSQSLTATLFDFSRGELGQCTSKTKTTPVESDGTTPIPSKGLAIPASGTLEVKDKAEVSVTGVSSFKGSVTFHLCGPFSASSTTRCSNEGGSTLGVQIGEAQPVTSNTTLTSSSATITEAGRYCWRADFSGDESKGLEGSSDSSATECFLITPKTPTLATEAGAGPVNFGSPVTDTATLAGTANEQGSNGPEGSTDGSINPTTAGKKAQGTITFKLYGPDKVGSVANCGKLAEGFSTAGLTASVNGDNTYGPVSFTPKSPGVYHWKAEYTGDLPNTTGPVSHNSDCSDAGEDVTVRQIETELSTTQKAFPQDSTTITSAVSEDNLPSNGTVIFRLYGPTDGATPKTGLENCQAHGEIVSVGGLLYEEKHSPVGGTHSVTLGTDNKTVSVNDTSQTSYFWRVTYATGDETHLGRQSNCVENVQVTFTNDAGPGTLFP